MVSKDLSLCSHTKETLSHRQAGNRKLLYFPPMSKIPEKMRNESKRSVKKKESR